MARLNSLPAIRAVERTVLDVPFTPRCEEWNALLVRNWRVVEICRIVTEDPELSGVGETVMHYTWQPVTDASVERVIGRNPAELLFDDSLGAGIQMALFDLVGKALGVPAHALMGQPRVREWVPIAWWNTKMPPEALAEEAKEAVAAGYLYHKFKARPFLDPFAQVEAIDAVTPDGYRVDMDWNDMLLNAGNAARILQELDQYEKVALYEGPIPQRDIEGYQQLRRRTNRPIAIHAGVPPFSTCVRADMCDGFVLSECGAAAALRHGALSAAFEKPFWLQPVGTGLTTAWGAHLGSVLPFAQWPMVTCLNNYADDLIANPHEVRHGQLKVPTAPGLGVDFDESTIAKYKMEPPYRLPERRHILTVAWPTGRRVHYAHMVERQGNHTKSPFAHAAYADFPQLSRQLWEDFLAGNQPIEPRGVQLLVRVDDGTADWAELYARCQRVPVTE